MITTDGREAAETEATGESRTKIATEKVAVAISNERLDMPGNLPSKTYSTAYCTARGSRPEMLGFETTVRPGTETVLRGLTFQWSMLASVLREISPGEFLKYLRHFSRSLTDAPTARPKPERASSFISLGRAIVVLYLITLLTAVISARTRADAEIGAPGMRNAEPQETAPHIAGS
jgi:hypothetical protein